MGSSQQKRMLIVTTVPQTIRAFLLPFATYFRQQGWRIDAMTGNPTSYDDIYSHFTNVWEVNFSRNPFALNHFTTIPKMIRRLISQEKYDLIHVHSPVAAFVTRFALRKIKSNKPKIVYTAHGFHFHSGGNLISNFLYILLEKIAGVWTDILVVINKEDEIAAHKYNLIPYGKVHYIPGIGIDTKKYSNHAISNDQVNELRQELTLQKNDRFFLMIAEFTPQKNHALIIEAFYKLANPTLHLVFAGTGKTQPKMKKLVAHYGLEKQIHFLGFRKDIPELISASIGVILISQREGLPRSIMEAMCLGKPVIGTNIRGIKDLVQAGAGIIIPHKTSEELVKALTFLADNPEQATLMGQQGSEQISHYHYEKILQLYNAIYEESLMAIPTL